jgi:hypothetical protein
VMCFPCFSSCFSVFPDVYVRFMCFAMLFCHASFVCCFCCCLLLFFFCFFVCIHFQFICGVLLLLFGSSCKWKFPVSPDDDACSQLNLEPRALCSLMQMDADGAESTQ